MEKINQSDWHNNFCLVLVSEITFYQCWARATLFSSRHRDVRHLLNLCANALPRRFFCLNFSGTAPLNFSATAPHFRAKIRAIKKIRNRAVIFKKCSPKTSLLYVPMSCQFIHKISCWGAEGGGGLNGGWWWRWWWVA